MLANMYKELGKQPIGIMLNVPTRKKYNNKIIRHLKSFQEKHDQAPLNQSKTRHVLMVSNAKTIKLTYTQIGVV